MDFSRKPVSGEYVILVANVDERHQIVENLEEFDTEEIKELPGALIVKARKESAAEGEMLERLRAIVGSQGSVLSLLEDTSGNRSIPTGNILVTLTKEMTGERLDNWLADHGAELVSKSKWLPNTITVFTKSEAQRYDNLLEQLRAEDDVQLADPEVLSNFSRLKQAR